MGTGRTPDTTGRTWNPTWCSNRACPGTARPRPFRRASPAHPARTPWFPRRASERASGVFLAAAPVALPPRPVRLTNPRATPCIVRAHSATYRRVTRCIDSICRHCSGYFFEEKYPFDTLCCNFRICAARHARMHISKSINGCATLRHAAQCGKTPCACRKSVFTTSHPLYSETTHGYVVITGGKDRPSQWVGTPPEYTAMPRASRGSQPVHRALAACAGSRRSPAEPRHNARNAARVSKRRTPSEDCSGRDLPP